MQIINLHFTCGPEKIELLAVEFLWLRPILNPHSFQRIWNNTVLIFWNFWALDGPQKQCVLVRFFTPQRFWRLEKQKKNTWLNGWGCLQPNLCQRKNIAKIPVTNKVSVTADGLTSCPLCPSFGWRDCGAHGEWWQRRPPPPCFSSRLPAYGRLAWTRNPLLKSWQEPCSLFLLKISKLS